MAHLRGTFCTVSLHRIDYAVVDFFEETRLPVVLEPGRIETVDKFLCSRIRDGSDLINQDGAESSKRFHDTLAFLDWPVVTERNTYDRSSVGQGNQNNARSQLVRCFNRQIAKESEDFFGLVERVSDQTGQHGANGMKLILHRRDHTEIPAAAAQTPEQVGVLRSAGGEQLPVGRDYVCRDQVVAGEAMLTRQITPSAAES